MQLGNWEERGKGRTEGEGRERERGGRIRERGEKKLD